MSTAMETDTPAPADKVFSPIEAYENLTSSMLLDLGFALKQQEVVPPPSRGLNAVQPFSFSIEAELEDNKESSFLTPRQLEAKAKRLALTDNGAYLHLNHYGYSTIAVIPHRDEEGEVVKKENLANKPTVKKPAAKKSGTKKPDAVTSVVKRQCKGPKVGIPLAKRAYNWKNGVDMRPKSVKHRESLGIAATPKEEVLKATPGKAKVAGRKRKRAFSIGDEVSLADVDVDEEGEEEEYKEYKGEDDVEMEEGEEEALFVSGGEGDEEDAFGIEKTRV
jgi:hypothetical protein